MHFRRFWLSCFLLSGFLSLSGCGIPAPAPTLTAKEAKQTQEAATQAAKPPEPTATITPTPLPSMIVNILGAYLLNMDPMDRVLETKFEVTDAWYGQDINRAVVFRITVNCDGLCSRERTFAVAIRALRDRLGALNGMIPTDIAQLEIITLNRFQPTGMVVVKWKDATDYCNWAITDTQLAGRISRP